jgi:hypothetical protein
VVVVVDLDAVVDERLPNCVDCDYEYVYAHDTEEARVITYETRLDPSSLDGGSE